MFIGQPLILRFEEVVSNITPALWQSNMGKSWKITKYSDMFPIQTSVFLHTHVCIYIYIPTRDISGISPSLIPGNPFFALFSPPKSRRQLGAL